MSTVATSIRIPHELAERYEQLAQQTGRSRDALMTEALEQFIIRETSQLQQTRQTLDALEAGQMPLIDGEKVLAHYLAEGDVTQDGLDTAQDR